LAYHVLICGVYLACIARNVKVQTDGDATAVAAEGELRKLLEDEVARSAELKAQLDKVALSLG